jgi:hypothetical protein
MATFVPEIPDRPSGMSCRHDTSILLRQWMEGSKIRPHLNDAPILT